MKKEEHAICMCAECQQKHILKLNVLRSRLSQVARTEFDDERSYGDWQDNAIGSGYFTKVNEIGNLQNLIGITDKTIHLIEKHNIDNLVDIHDKLLVKFDTDDEESIIEEGVSKAAIRSSHCLHDTYKLGVL